MWKRSRLAQQHCRAFHYSAKRQSDATKPIIDIRNGTFYRRYPSTSDTPRSNPPIFPDLTFQLLNGGAKTPQYWSILSPSSLARTTFLQILAGQHVCVPPTARSYPHLSDISESPQHAVKYVGFDADRGTNVGGTSVRGAYLSARYESRREETDYSLQDYLTGNTELNALERQVSSAEQQSLARIVEQLNLGPLLTMPVANLSNGQTRRARIAKALMARPEVLLLDGPFMGLDPNTLASISSVLRQLAQRQQPRLVISLRPEDGIPEWTSHLVVLDEHLRILAQGEKHDVFARKHKQPAAQVILDIAKLGHDAVSTTKLSRDGFPQSSPALPPGEPLVEMEGVKVAYGEKTVLGGWAQTLDGHARTGLHWSLHRGQRCGIFGANGSGKTTMLSLITSDHPQTYSLPIKLFGRSRLPEPGRPGISLFDIQKRMGHSSPEVHAFFPRALTVRRALQSAWADAPMAKPRLDAEASRRVDACLRWFAPELNPSMQKARNGNVIDEIEAVSEGEAHTTFEPSWSDDVRFGELSFSNQRLVLFLRAIITTPDLVILDEALSGIDEATRDKALLFLSHGENLIRRTRPDGSVEIGESALRQTHQVTMSGLSSEQALLVISHAREDVPGCLREWIRLPEPESNATPRIGRLPGPLELNPQCWADIWAPS